MAPWKAKFPEAVELCAGNSRADGKDSRGSFPGGEAMSFWSLTAVGTCCFGNHACCWMGAPQRPVLQGPAGKITLEPGREISFQLTEDKCL